MAEGVDGPAELRPLARGETRLLIQASGVKRSEGSKSKWRPRHFCLVEVGTGSDDKDGESTTLEFRWGVDKSCLKTGARGCKSLPVSALTEVNVGTAADKVKWPYAFSSDLSTCFALHTAKRRYHWAAFPATAATAVRARLAIELLKTQEAAGDRPRAATMQSLREAVSHEAGRNAVLKSHGWRAAVEAVGKTSDAGMKDVADELITSLKAKRVLLDTAGVPQDIAEKWLADDAKWSDAAEVDKTLETLWALEASRAPAEPPVIAPPPRGSERTAWVEVRCFVSSTFADMHAEREVLVRKVFPRLRAWAEPRRIRIVECDLRWGVPRGAKNETIFRTCLEEVDRCVLANTHCFFLNMLSERYGWAPIGPDVPDSVIQDFEWTPFASVTTMEILHAAFRTRNPNALFMFRDGGFAAELKQEHQGAFTHQDALAAVALPKLKAKIREHFPAKQVGEYSCSVTGYDTSTGVEKVVLGGLDKGFADRVYDFFVHAIAREYGDDVPPALTEKDRLASAHREHAATLASACVGRKAMTEQVAALARGDPAAHGGRIEIVGVPGIGVSTVAATTVAALAESPDVAAVVYHNLQLGGDDNASDERGGSAVVNLDTGIGGLYERLCAEFAAEGSEGGGADGSEEDGAEKRAGFKDAVESLERAAAECAPRRIVVVVDGDAGLRISRGSDLALPSNVVWVTCAHVGDAGDPLAPCEDGTVACARVVVEDLDHDSRRELAIAQLGKFNKTMDASQLDALTSKASAGSPSWLTLACEEMRVFGVFERVTEKIASLADSFEGLLEQLLERVLSPEEDADGVVGLLLGCVALSSGGLFESELRQLLAEPFPGKAAPPVGPEDDDTEAAAAAAAVAPSDEADAAAVDELPYLDWAVAVAKAEPLLWSESGLISLRSNAVARVVDGKLFRNEKGEFVGGADSLSGEIYRRLVDFFARIEPSGLDTDAARRVARILANAGLATGNTRALCRVRGSPELFRAMPLGFTRNLVCERLRCRGMVHTMPGHASAGRGRAPMFIDPPGYCLSCSWKRGASLLWRNDCSCYVCGNNVPSSPMPGAPAAPAGSLNERIPARVCTRHDIELKRGGRKCTACGRLSTLHVAAAVCRQCSMTMGGKRCCCLDLGSG